MQRIGKNMREALVFYSKCNGWHSFTMFHRPTYQAMFRLEKQGFVEIVNQNQARLTDKGRLYFTKNQ